MRELTLRAHTHTRGAHYKFQLERKYVFLFFFDPRLHKTKINELPSPSAFAPPCRRLICSPIALDVVSLASSMHEPDLVECAPLGPSPRLAPRRLTAHGPLLPHGSDGWGRAFGGASGSAGRSGTAR